MKDKLGFSQLNKTGTAVAAAYFVFNSGNPTELAIKSAFELGDHIVESLKAFKTRAGMQ